MRLHAATAILVLLAPASAAFAQSNPPPRVPDPPPKVTPLGYVEAHYAYNFNAPSNGITNFRGFDNRHNTFTLSNVALGAAFEGGPFTAKAVVQVGSLPTTYYAGEPALGGAGGANVSNAELWKYIQEARVGVKAPIGRGLLLELGLFPSAIGFENIPIKDNWHWSHSNLFYGFPFYHAGLRASYPWTDKLATAVWIMNGWNSVVDNNEAKTIMINTSYTDLGTLDIQMLYVGGIERSANAPEGMYWRHLFDFTAQWDVKRWLSLAAQLDYGFEPNRFGIASFAAFALYARAQPIEKRLFFAVRADRFHENLARRGSLSSSPIFWGGIEWVSSVTATAEVRPHDQVSIRLEYRHDAASAPLFFAGAVTGDGTQATPFLANARTQDTLTLGATAWF